MEVFSDRRFLSMLFKSVSGEVSTSEPGVSTGEFGVSFRLSEAVLPWNSENKPTKQTTFRFYVLK